MILLKLFIIIAFFNLSLVGIDRIAKRDVDLGANALIVGLILAFIVILHPYKWLFL